MFASLFLRGLSRGGRRSSLPMGLAMGLASSLLLATALPASAQFISDIEVIVTTGNTPPPPTGDGWVLHPTSFGTVGGNTIWTYTRVGTGATPLTDLIVTRTTVAPGFPWFELSAGDLNASSNFHSAVNRQHAYGTRNPACQAIVEIDYILRDAAVPAGWQKAKGDVISAGGDQPSDDRQLIYRTEDLGQWL